MGAFGLFLALKDWCLEDTQWVTLPKCHCWEKGVPLSTNLQNPSNDTLHRGDAWAFGPRAPLPTAAAVTTSPIHREFIGPCTNSFPILAGIIGALLEQRFVGEVRRLPRGGWNMTSLLSGLRADIVTDSSGCLQGVCAKCQYLP